MNIRILINGTDITANLLKEGFPKALKRRVKKTGFFSFSTQSFSFSVFDPSNTLNIRRNQPARIYVNGELRINGFISKIEDDNSITPKITVQPYIALLKDVIVGEPVEDETNEENPDKYFKTDSYKTIREIVTDLLNDVATKKGVSFQVPGAMDIPEEVDTPLVGWSGLKLKHIEVGPEKLVKAIISFLLPGTINASKCHFRKKAGVYFFIEEGAGFTSKVWIEQGQWLNWTFKKDWTILGVDFGFNFGTFRVPPTDVRIPTFAGKYHVYRCEAGNLVKEATHTWHPMLPWGEGEPDLRTMYGDKITSITGDNLPVEKIKKFCRDEIGLVKSTVDVKAKFDLDDYNSYVILSGRRENEIIEDWYLLSFQTPFDNKFRLHYKNATAITILKDLAVASFRYLYLDENNCIKMPGRLSETVDATLPGMAIKSEKRSRQSMDASMGVNINRFEKDQNGKVFSYGLYMGKDEQDELDKFYKSVWADKDVIRTERQYITHLTPVPNLLEQVDGATIVEIEEPLDEGDELKIVSERLVDND